MSAAESLRELKERREFDTPTDRNTYRQGQLAEYAILAALPEMVAVVEAAEDVSAIERTGSLPDFMPLADALAALDAKLALRRVEVEQGRLDDSRRVAD